LFLKRRKKFKAKRQKSYHKSGGLKIQAQDKNYYNTKKAVVTMRTKALESRV
jgi:hypothetical protein